MKLWSFIFTNPASQCLSARVAADTKEKAGTILHQYIEEPTPSNNGRVIIQFMGMIDADAAGIVQIEARRP